MFFLALLYVCKLYIYVHLYSAQVSLTKLQFDCLKENYENIVKETHILAKETQDCYILYKTKNEYISVLFKAPHSLINL